MEKFKKKIKKRIIIQLLTIIIIAAVYFILHYNKDSIAGDPNNVSFVQGFQTGLFIAVLAVSLNYIIKYFLAVKNEEKLKDIYISENDERTIMINQKTDSFSMQLSLILLVLASIIAGFYNQVVFFSLVATIVFLGLIRLFSYLYFNHKY
ncbi:MAG: hypothetical protein ACOCRU_00690 [bacterium]